MVAQPQGSAPSLGLWTIIPPSLQEQILSELHKVHPGVARMKAAAYNHVWWPGIDSNIEESTQVQTAFQNQQQEFPLCHGLQLQGSA